MKTLNALIVTHNASYIAFARDTYIEIAQEVKRMCGDSFYAARRNDPVYIAPRDPNSNVEREMYLVGDLIDDLEAGRIPEGGLS